MSEYGGYNSQPTLWAILQKAQPKWGLQEVCKVQEKLWKANVIDVESLGRAVMEGSLNNQLSALGERKLKPSTISQLKVQCRDSWKKLQKQQEGAQICATRELEARCRKLWQPSSEIAPSATSSSSSAAATSPSHSSSHALPAIKQTRASALAASSRGARSTGSLGQAGKAMLSSGKSTLKDPGMPSKTKVLPSSYSVPNLRRARLEEASLADAASVTSSQAMIERQMGKRPPRELRVGPLHPQAGSGGMRYDDDALNGLLKAAASRLRRGEIRPLPKEDDVAILSDVESLDYGASLQSFIPAAAVFPPVAVGTYEPFDYRYQAPHAPAESEIRHEIMEDFNFPDYPQPERSTKASLGASFHKSQSSWRASGVSFHKSVEDDPEMEEKTADVQHVACTEESLAQHDLEALEKMDAFPGNADPFGAAGKEFCDAIFNGKFGLGLYSDSPPDTGSVCTVDRTDAYTSTNTAMSGYHAALRVASPDFDALFSQANGANQEDMEDTYAQDFTIGESLQEMPGTSPLPNAADTYSSQEAYSTDDGEPPVNSAASPAMSDAFEELFPPERTSSKATVVSLLPERDSSKATAGSVPPERTSSKATAGSSATGIALEPAVSASTPLKIPPPMRTGSKDELSDNQMEIDEMSDHHLDDYLHGSMLDDIARGSTEQICSAAAAVPSDTSSLRRGGASDTSSMARRRRNNPAAEAAQQARRMKWINTYGEGLA